MAVTIMQAFANFAKNRNVAAQVVASSAAELATNWARVSSLVAAGKLASVQVTGTSAAISAPDMVKIVSLRPTIAVGADFKVQDTAANLIANMANLSQATSFTLTSTNTVLIADAVTLAGKKNFSVGSGATFVISGTGNDILASTAAAAIKLATNFSVSTATAAQAITLAALPQFKASGENSTIVTVADTWLAIKALSSSVLAQVTNLTLTGANTLTAAEAQALRALKPLNALASGATFVISGTQSELLSSNADFVSATTKATGFTLTGTSNIVDKVNGQLLVAKVGFAVGNGATLTVSDTAANIRTANAALIKNATSWTLSASATMQTVQQALILATRANFSLGAYTLGITGSVSSLIASSAAPARAIATTFNVEGTISAAQAASIMTAIPTFTYSSGSRMSVAGSAAALKTNLASLAQADVVTLTGSNTVAIADAIALKALRGNASFVLGAGSSLAITGSAADILAGPAAAAVGVATSFQVSGTVTTGQASSLAALGNFTVSGGSVMNVVGSASALVGIATALDKATSVTVTETSNGISVADAITLAAKHNFTVASGVTYGITGTYLDLIAAGAVRAVASATSITATKVGGLTASEALALVALNPFAAYTMTVTDTAANLLLDADTIAAVSKASVVQLSANAAAVTVADAITLTGFTGFSLNSFTLAITGTAADILAGGAATAAAAATTITITAGTNIVDVDDLTFLDGLSATVAVDTSVDLEVQDTAARLISYDAGTGDLTGGIATVATVTGTNSVSASDAATLATFDGITVTGTLVVSGTKSAILAATAPIGTAYVVTDTLAVVDASTLFAFDNTVSWTFAEITGTYATLMSTPGTYETVVTSSLTTFTKITLTGQNAAVPIAHAITLSAEAGFRVGSGASFDIIGSRAALTADNDAARRAAGLATDITVSDATVTVSQALAIIALNSTATFTTLHVVDTAENIIAADLTKLKRATDIVINANVTLSVSDAELLLSAAATQDAGGYTALLGGNTLTVQDTGENILNSDLVLAGATGFDCTSATADEATTLDGLTSGSFLNVGLVVADTADNLTNASYADGIAAADSVTLSGVNELLADNVTALSSVTRAAGTTIIVADTWAEVKANAAAVELLAAADTADLDLEDKFFSVELTGDDALTLSAAEYGTLDDTLDHVIGVSGFTVTVADATAANLITGYNNNGLRNVVSVDASAASTTITIDLSDQAEGFTVTGGSGANTILGGAAANTILGGGVVDTITGGVAADTIDGGAGADVIDGGAGADSIAGGAGADAITGGAGADKIDAGADGDTITGFVGADTVDGGDGADTLVLAATSTDLNAAANAQLVNVETVSASNAGAAVTIDLSKQSDDFTITGATGEINTITGSSGANTITGGSAADIITGGAGADNITGFGAADKILSGAGNDVINNFDGADTVDGGLGTDTLLLSATQASLATAVDTQLMNVETVSAIGVNADITIDVHLQTEALTIRGTVTGTRANTIIGSAGANNITGGGGADTITGGAGADIITAGAGADQINGFVGADTIDGGDGADSLVLTATSLTLNTADDAQLVSVATVTASGAAAAVIINLSKQSDGFTITGATGQINTITGSSGADNITGGSAADVFNGYAGDDTINGGGGNDTLVLTGSITTAGNDRLVSVEYVSAATLTTAVTINLSAEGEAETITGGGGADSIYGGSAADKISGGAGNDVINNFGGDDTVDGGLGTDTLLLSATQARLALAVDTQLMNVETVSAIGVNADITIDVHLQNEALTILGTVTGTRVNTIYGSAGANNITGGGGADVITGGAVADKISAGAGGDTINGFVGADTIDGGDGTDTLVLTATSLTFNTATDAQLVNVETVSASSAGAAVTIDLSKQSDGFTITGASNQINTITGSSGADAITGGSAADIFIGFVGADTITGGGGTDTLRLTGSLASATNPQLVGIAKVSAATLTAGTVINLGNQAEGFEITGGSGADVITGGSAADTIIGFVGADTVDGGGNSGDQLVLTATSLTLNTATDAQLTNVEIVTASAATVGVVINLSKQSDAMSITGGSGADTITGGTGAETIKGGVGADSLTGGATGVNTFDYTALADSLVANFDTITDFKTTDQFKIGHTIASNSDVKQLTQVGTGNLVNDLTSALSNTSASNFVVSAASVVTITGTGAGRYLAINDGTAAFDASRDTVVKLSGTAVVSNTNFIS